MRSRVAVVVSLVVSGCFSDGGFSGPPPDATTSTSTSTSEAGSEGMSTTGGEQTTTGTLPTGSSTGDPMSCGAVVDVGVEPPNVMLVLDKSSSMAADSSRWDHDGDDGDGDGMKDDDRMAPATPMVTRWKSLHGAVEVVTTAFNNSVNFGVVLFPSKSAKSSYDEMACVVEMMPDVPIGPTNAAAILNAIPAAHETGTIQGATPASRGLKAGLVELLTIPAEQSRAIILVTDGPANCAPGAVGMPLFESYDETLHELVGDAFAVDGIATHVVGIAIEDETSPEMADGSPDNTNPYTRLNELADLGGRPLPGTTKFHDAQNQVELEAAFDAIARQLVPCTVTLDPAPLYPEHLEIEVNGVVYGDEVADCASQDGWMYASATYEEIAVCGQACTDFQVAGHLGVNYRCPP